MSKDSECRKNININDTILKIVIYYFYVQSSSYLVVLILYLLRCIIQYKKFYFSAHNKTKKHHRTKKRGWKYWHDSFLILEPVLPHALINLFIYISLYKNSKKNLIY